MSVTQIDRVPSSSGFIRPVWNGCGSGVDGVFFLFCFLLAFGRVKVRGKHAWQTGRQQVQKKHLYSFFLPFFMSLFLFFLWAGSHVVSIHREPSPTLTI